MLDISDLPTRHNYYLALWQSRIEHTLADWVLEMAVPIYYGMEVRGFRLSRSGLPHSLGRDCDCLGVDEVAIPGGKLLNQIFARHD